MAWFYNKTAQGRPPPLLDNIWIFDFEVFSHDWLFGVKSKETGDYIQIWNDSDAVYAFMHDDPVLASFNGKHYDQFILRGVLNDFTPERVKEVNDFIITEKMEGWHYPWPDNSNTYFRHYDLMDDTQVGMSLKAIEAHLGMNIEETTVDFNIDRPLTEEERRLVEKYNRADLDATDVVDDLRRDYLATKKLLGGEVGISPARAMSMTNAKLTAAFLGARAIPHDDERKYVPPKTILWEYIPKEVLEFFSRIYDKSIPDEVLFKESLELTIGGCPCKVAWGGLHGAILVYQEKATGTRLIVNLDVASYYPHQMTLNGFTSRNMRDPGKYAATIERRVAAKHSGDKKMANALKLPLNTTYGAMLNRYNDLYDPLMGRSVCISGQLQLIELTVHLVQDCPTLKVIQLNTDGIMVSLDQSDYATYEAIYHEWEHRTGFELEEDKISAVIQRDVNNYIEIQTDGSIKQKGGVLVRGIAPVGAFKVNNTAVVVARAVAECLAKGIPVEDTINADDHLLDFQIIAKAGSSYNKCLHEVNGSLVEVQKVNRVYACNDYTQGTLYKVNAETGRIAKIPSLPGCCMVDNDNHLDVSILDKDWYIGVAQRQVNDFQGKPKPKRNTRNVNKLVKQLATAFDY